MSEAAIYCASLIDMLPEEDKKLAISFLEKLVLAWDPFFVKTTPEEEARIAAAEASGFVVEEENS